MDNQGECYEALLAGETLVYAENDDKIKLKDGNQIQTNGKNIDYAFSCPKDWQIYKEPKWYENIPDGGVLCWFGEGKSICIVFPVIPNADFNSSYYAPLTKAEIQVFMENAPDNKLTEPRQIILSCNHNLVPNRTDIEPDYYKCPKCNHVQGNSDE